MERSFRIRIEFKNPGRLPRSPGGAYRQARKHIGQGGEPGPFWIKTGYEQPPGNGARPGRRAGRNRSGAVQHPELVPALLLEPG
jgi:hypothetical protein